MSTHTKGPWEVHDVNADCLLIRGDVPNSAEDRDYYRSLATVTQRNPHPRFGGGISHETCAANARLIAAAPELLEALQSLIREHDEVFAGRDDGARDSYYNAHPGRAIAYRNARAAIAKATGGAA